MYLHGATESNWVLNRFTKRREIAKPLSYGVGKNTIFCFVISVTLFLLFYYLNERDLPGNCLVQLAGIPCLKLWVHTGNCYRISRIVMVWVIASRRVPCVTR